MKGTAPGGSDFALMSIRSVMRHPPGAVWTVKRCRQLSNSPPHSSVRKVRFAPSISRNFISNDRAGRHANCRIRTRYTLSASQRGGIPPSKVSPSSGKEARTSSAGDRAARKAASGESRERLSITRVTLWLCIGFPLGDLRPPPLFCYKGGLLTNPKEISQWKRRRKKASRSTLSSGRS